MNNVSGLEEQLDMTLLFTKSNQSWGGGLGSSTHKPQQTVGFYYLKQKN